MSFIFSTARSKAVARKATLTGLKFTQLAREGNATTMQAYARNHPARIARKLIVAVLGSTVLALGIALIVLPGPAVVVIPLGLTILGSEFLWARRLLHRVKQDANRLLGGTDPR
jgi:hypothetical protein